MQKLFPEHAENIRQGKIVQGMSEDVLKRVLGKPAETKETVLKTKVKVTCFYHPYFTPRNTLKYRFRVDVENDAVVGWKEL